jgi:hypothetical protein
MEREILWLTCGVVAGAIAVHKRERWWAVIGVSLLGPLGMFAALASSGRGSAGCRFTEGG